MKGALFHWDEYNEAKVDAHGLSRGEVEYAWLHAANSDEYQHPKHGTYWRSTGVCPSGRMIMMIWRWNVREGLKGVYVITAY
ncbi:MAG: hypothetical protein ACYTAF_10375 [Planctomycetota bacterium]|jgi:hypothetical protein